MWHLATFTKVTNSTACVVSPRASKDLWCAGIYARHDFANKPLEHSIQHISSREITQDTYEPALTPAILTAVSQKHDMTCRCRPWEKDSNWDTWDLSQTCNSVGILPTRSCAILGPLDQPCLGTNPSTASGWSTRRCVPIEFVPPSIHKLPEILCGLILSIASIKVRFDEMSKNLGKLE